MSSATITSKGRITIPYAVRSDLHISPGDSLEFVKISSGRYEVVTAAQDVTTLIETELSSSEPGFITLITLVPSPVLTV